MHSFMTSVLLRTPGLSLCDLARRLYVNDATHEELGRGNLSSHRVQRHGTRNDAGQWQPLNEVQLAIGLPLGLASKLFRGLTKKTRVAHSTLDPRLRMGESYPPGLIVHASRKAYPSSWM